MTAALRAGMIQNRPLSLEGTTEDIAAGALLTIDVGTSALSL
jgi:hypothetical protein